MLYYIFLIIVALIYFIPFVLLVQKAGYSWMWALLVLVPGVNLIAAFLFVVCEWPIERELKRQKWAIPLEHQGPSAADLQADADWELKQLVKHVTLVEQLAAHNGPKQMLDTIGESATEYYDKTITSLEDFVKQATDDEERALAETLLNRARNCEGKIQDA